MHGERAGPILLTLALMLTAACAIRPEFKPSSEAASPECPHDWGEPRAILGAPPKDSLWDGTLTLTMGAGTGARRDFEVPGPTTSVPEFHDCQRLRRWDGEAEEYGPLAAVFARNSVHAIPVTDSSLGSGAVVALVYMPQGGYYHPLNITDRFGCVAVRREIGGTQAWLVPVQTESECLRPGLRDRLVEENRLSVQESLPSADIAPMSIPPVARWDWDETTHTQYIGVACGSAWCEIGRKDGFTSSPTYAASSPEDQAYALKGAYDEQRLAEWSPEMRLIAGQNLGTVVPTPDLARLAADPTADGEWITVARVHMDPGAGPYAKEFNFTGTAVASGAADAPTLALCRTAENACRSGRRFRPLNVAGCTADDDGFRWVARTVRTGLTRYYCVVYRGHAGGFAIPPVVRWRWRANDETIWVSCPRGCCEVKART